MTGRRLVAAREQTSKRSLVDASCARGSDVPQRPPTTNACKPPLQLSWNAYCSEMDRRLSSSFREPTYTSSDPAVTFSKLPFPFKDSTTGRECSLLLRLRSEEQKSAARCPRGKSEVTTAQMHNSRQSERCDAASNKSDVASNRGRRPAKRSRNQDDASASAAATDDCPSHMSRQSLSYALSLRTTILRRSEALPVAVPSRHDLEQTSSPLPSTAESSRQEKKSQSSLFRVSESTSDGRSVASRSTTCTRRHSAFNDTSFTMYRDDVESGFAPPLAEAPWGAADAACTPSRKSVHEQLREDADLVLPTPTKHITTPIGASQHDADTTPPATRALTRVADSERKKASGLFAAERLSAATRATMCRQTTTTVAAPPPTYVRLITLPPSLLLPLSAAGIVPFRGAVASQVAALSAETYGPRTATWRTASSDVMVTTAQYAVAVVHDASSASAEVPLSLSVTVQSFDSVIDASLGRVVCGGTDDSSSDERRQCLLIYEAAATESLCASMGLEALFPSSSSVAVAALSYDDDGMTGQYTAVTLPSPAVALVRFSEALLGSSSDPALSAQALLRLTVKMLLRLGGRKIIHGALQGIANWAVTVDCDAPPTGAAKRLAVVPLRWHRAVDLNMFADTRVGISHAIELDNNACVRDALKLSNEAAAAADENNAVVVNVHLGYDTSAAIRYIIPALKWSSLLPQQVADQLAHVGKLTEVVGMKPHELSFALNGLLRVLPSPPAAVEGHMAQVFYELTTR